MDRAAAIIVAGGSGQRAGRAKQWELLLGRRVIDWSIDAFCGHPAIGHVVVVADERLGERPDRAPVIRAEPGATRTASVRSGLAALALAGHAKVLIHDAARPGLMPETIDALLSALETADAAAPALPVTDALKAWRDGRLSGVDRDGLFRIQTPQAFRLGTIRAALDRCSDDLVDDLAAVEAAGVRIALVPGDIRLSKITFPEDFDTMSRLLGPSLLVPRVGKGFDVHGFVPGDHVTLCGVRIPHTSRLDGHSDADAAWHALTDAILGAAALGDIGDHFPPSDARWKDADSGIFLQHAQKIAREAGFIVASCDITLICETPRIKPHRDAMRTSTAERLGLPLEAVSVKATTTEGLGFTGRREGLAAEAVAVLIPAG